MMTVDMKALVEEKVADRADQIKGDFHDDYLAQGIRSEIRRAFGLSRYDSVVDEAGRYAYMLMDKWYKDHKMVVESYDRYSYGDF